jgi:hypothetical protein
MRNDHDARLAQPETDDDTCDHESGCERRWTTLIPDPRMRGMTDRALCDEHARAYRIAHPLRRFPSELAVTALAFAIGCSWLIGRVAHVVGFRHSLGHALCEVLVLGCVFFVALRAKGRR